MKFDLLPHQCLSLILLLTVAASCSLTAGHRAEAADVAREVSIESLLSEMVDRDSVARFPADNFRLKQASSYNRASKSPDDAKGWFNNKDHSGQVIRVEGEGDEERVGPNGSYRARCDCSVMDALAQSAETG